VGRGEVSPSSGEGFQAGRRRTLRAHGRSVATPFTRTTDAMCVDPSLCFLLCACQRDGILTDKELRSALAVRGLDLTEKQAEWVVRRLKGKHARGVDYEQFVAALQEEVGMQ
jgi:Ca2+-binding EF-hand superfamily protein